MIHGGCSCPPPCKCCTGDAQCTRMRALVCDLDVLTWPNTYDMPSVTALSRLWHVMLWQIPMPTLRQQPVRWVSHATAQVQTGALHAPGWTVSTTFFKMFLRVHLAAVCVLIARCIASLLCAWNQEQSHMQIILLTAVHHRSLQRRLTSPCQDPKQAQRHSNAWS